MERIKIAREIVRGMDQKSMMFWLDVLVKRGELSKAEAGFLLTY
jgi:hypothetical protein